MTSLALTWRSAMAVQDTVSGYYAGGYTGVHGTVHEGTVG